MTTTLIEAKETLKVLLYHCFHFFEIDDGIPAARWLLFILEIHAWYLGSVALLLRRQGNDNLPIQHLGGCLHLAIVGSFNANADELTEALILSVTEGADIHAQDHYGRSVSQIACDTKTSWRDGSYLRNETYTMRENCDLRLKMIWTNVLTACAYNAKEVISASAQAEELIEDDNNSGSDQSEKSDNTVSDCFEDDDSNCMCPNCGGCDDHCLCNDPLSSRQFDVTSLPSEYERSLLEGDALAWQS